MTLHSQPSRICLKSLNHFSVITIYQFVPQTQVSTFSLFVPTDPAPRPAHVVSQGGEGESGGGLSHGGSRELSPWCLLPDEDLLGAGAPQKTCFPQTERET